MDTISIHPAAPFNGGADNYTLRLERRRIRPAGGIPLGMSKLQTQRKSRARILRERLAWRYLGTASRRLGTTLGLFVIVAVLVAIHLAGRAAEGKTPLARSRAESLRIAAAYVQTADFERTFVDPLRNVFKRGALFYTNEPRQIVDQIIANQRHTRFEEMRIEDMIALSAEMPRSFARTPVTHERNFSIEVLRNAREHLAHSGHDVRSQPDKERFQTFLETVFVPAKLAQLERSLPGICPGHSVATVPMTQEFIAHAIARRLEVPYCELGELLYCSERIEAAQRKRVRTATSASVAATSLR